MGSKLLECHYWKISTVPDYSILQQQQKKLQLTVDREAFKVLFFWISSFQSELAENEVRV